MAKLSITGGVITIELRLWDKILAVHGSLHIPLENVISASAGPPPPVPWFTKLMGTNAPGIAAMGTFFTHEGLAFYDYAAGHRSLILEMRHEHCVRAIVEIDAPQTADGAAADIEAALAGARIPGA